MIDINKAKRVYSSLGKINAIPTARTAKDEVIWTPPQDYIDSCKVIGNYSKGKDSEAIGDITKQGGAASKILTGKRGQDTELANVGTNDVIFGGLTNLRTGYKYQDDPVLNTMSMPMLNTLNKIETKMRKNHEKHGYDQFAINSEKVFYKLSQPMKEEANKYNASLAQDQANDRQIYDAVKQYKGLMRAKNGKDFMRLPGFEFGKGPHGEANEYNALQAYLPPKPAKFNGTQEQWEQLLGVYRDPFIVNKQYKSGGVYPRYAKHNEFRDYSILAPKVKDVNISKELENNPVKLVAPEYRYKGNNDQYGPYKLNPYDSFYFNGVGALGAIGQAIDASGQRISTPNLYAANPYARQALSGMASVKYDPYWVRQYMQQNNRNTAYRLNNQGGLTAGQRYIARVGAQLGMNEQFAKLDQNIQDINNKYKLSYYDALNRAGQAEQNARMTANQENYNAWAASHNAREQYKQMAYKNLMNYLTQAYKDYSDAKMYNGMRSLYWQDLDERKKDRLARLNNR